MGGVRLSALVLFLMMLLLPAKNWPAILAFRSFIKSTNTNFLPVKEASINPEFVAQEILHLNTNLPFAKNQNQI